MKRIYRSIKPSSITSLTIRFLADGGIARTDTLHDAISHFPLLLHFSCLSSSLTPEAVKGLSLLRQLESVSIENKSKEGVYELSFSSVKAMLDGPDALHSLSSLVLPLPSNHTVNRSALHHLDEGYRLSCDSVTGKIIHDPSWTPPAWTSECTVEQAKELVELAEKKNVSLNPSFNEVVLDTMRCQDEVSG